MTPHSNHSIDIEPPKASAAPPPGKRRKGAWWIFLGLAVIALLSVPIWRRLHDGGDKPQAGAGAKPERKPSVTAVELKPRAFAVVLEGLGTVTPLSTVTVKSQVDGPLLSVAYQEGHDVHRGQLLAEIDPRPFRIKLAQAKSTVQRDQAQLQNAQLDLGRYQSLLGQKLIAQQQLDLQKSTVDQLTATVAADQANADDAALQLQYTRITSPIDGVAGIRLVDPGNLVRTADTTGIVTLTQLDPIAVIFTLPQDDLPRLALAMSDAKPKVAAWSRAGDELLGEGTLTVIDNQINTQTASVRLKAQFSNSDRKLWPNQFVRARIEVSHQPDALLLPAAAVQHGPDGSYVYVLSPDNKAHMQPVTVALLQGTDALISAGLRGGERVVVEGQEQIKPDSQVNVRGPRLAQGAAGTHKDQQAAGNKAEQGKP
jgi:membrane fusion protein, multidrug efflux system